MKLLNKYLNGNVTVTLFDNGTKIQEWDNNEGAHPDYPNSMDIKITDYCDAGCKWCHEKSTIKGKHADLEYLLEIIQDLPKGTELAIGGGNPLSHPGLVPFLISCKSLGLIPNLTVNYFHIIAQYPLINKLIDNKLIYGLGLSIPDIFNFDMIDLINNKSNVVYHVIAGVNKLYVLNKIKASPVKKCLILGYKNYGHGEKYYSEKVQNCLNDWNENLGQYIKKIHLSFDNLALKQLNIKQYLTDEEWSRFYCGGDGSFTMYWSAVENFYSVSSTTPIKLPVEGDMKSIFTNVKKLAKELNIT